MGLELTFLSQVTGILGPFAWVMGQILKGIYWFLDLFGIANIAICIVLFTIVVKMLMLPLTIKQQKGTRLSAKMNPEIQKIQQKYKGKKDQASMQKQQAEMQEVYAKYGTSPMAGCLPLLISLPIMFALYQVIYKIPAYVEDVRSLYDFVAIQFSSVDGYIEGLKNFISAYKINVPIGNLPNLDPTSDAAKTALIDIFSKFNTANWDAFLNFQNWNASTGTEVIQYFTNANSLAQLKEVLALPELTEKINDIKHINRFIGSLNILDNPGWSFPGIIIPIGAAGTQFLQSKLMMATTPTNNSNQATPGGDTMKTMNTVMPIVSGIFCVFMPIGVGIYWITSSVVQIFQQIFINKYFDKIDMDELIAKNVEKSNKRKEKLGVATGNKMASVAKTSTKVIENSPATIQSKAVSNKKTEASNYTKSEVSYKAGSISANANILKRNSDKGDK